ncbi:MAG: hypothetical protein IJ593_07255 [Lachnospiraceae bacterium]|jgi:hypothetical protein|nr:hypothetical protein [Lachnospiraceae bacterium]
MKERLAKLIDVKSIVTLILTATFVVVCILCYMNKTDIPQYFQTIYSVVIAFYFGTQYQKDNIKQ